MTAHSTATDGPTRRKAHDQLRLHLPARFNGKRHTCLPENKVPVPGVCPPQLVTGHPFVSLATALPSSWQELPQLLIGSCFLGQSAGQVHPSLWERLSPQGSVRCLQLRLGASVLSCFSLPPETDTGRPRGQRELRCPAGVLPGEPPAKAEESHLSFIHLASMYRASSMKYTAFGSEQWTDTIPAPSCLPDTK